MDELPRTVPLPRRSHPAARSPHRDTATEGFVQLSDVRLHYVTKGDGPLVVLLHGFPDFWYSWRHQIAPLAAAGFRVVAPDMRGFNRSDKPRGTSHYTLDRLATDIVELAGRLGSDRAHVVGHDWGGLVAYAVAAWHPDAVARTVILNAPHADDYLRGLKSVKQLGKSWYTGFLQMPGSPALLRAKECALLRRALLRTSTAGAFSPDDLQEYVRAWSEPRALESQVAYYRAGGRRTLGRSERLPQITAPVMVVWGERDWSLESFFATPARDLVRDVRVELLPEATHWVHMDEPDKVTELLLDFLA